MADRTFRAADVVFHKPSREKWVLACDEERGEVICCGWPESAAEASDCELVKPGTDTERRDLLQRVAKSCVDQIRGRRALRQLATVPNPPCSTCVVQGDDPTPTPAVRKVDDLVFCAKHWQLEVATAQAQERRAIERLEAVLNAPRISMGEVAVGY